MSRPLKFAGVPSSVLKNSSKEELLRPETWSSQIRQQALDVAPETLLRYGLSAMAFGGAAAGLQRLLAIKREQRARASEQQRQQVPPLRVVIPSQSSPPGLSKVAFASGLLGQLGVPNLYDSIIKNRYAQSPWDFTWFPTAAAGAVAAGGIAGYKGSDMILDKLRRSAKQRRLDAAQQEYEEALAGPVPGKLASERSEFARNVDKVVAAYDAAKQANEKALPEWDDGHSASRYVGNAAGAYLLAAAVLGLTGARRGFAAQRSTSKTRAVERANLERQLSKPKQPDSAAAVAYRLPVKTEPKEHTLSLQR